MGRHRSESVRPVPERDDFFRRRGCMGPLNPDPTLERPEDHAGDEMPSWAGRMAFRLMMGSGAVVLPCIPLIYWVESRGVSQAPVNLAQWLALIICVVSGVAVLRSPGQGSLRSALAIVGVGACGLFILFIIMVVISYASTMRDF